MNKIFIDTEFLEGSQKFRIPYTNIAIGNTKPTIDLISIALVREDSHYYAISKDFNLREAWNRYDEKINEKYDPFQEESAHNPHYIRTYWIRENVLLPIYKQNVGGDARNHIDFSYKGMKLLLNKIGKTNKQILEEVKDFISLKSLLDFGKDSILGLYGMSSEMRATFDGRMEYIKMNWGEPEFYGYFADYDWVNFCWLFGKMNELPDSFPKYCKDLKQMLDAKVNALNWVYGQHLSKNDASLKSNLGKKVSFNDKLEAIKELDSFPKEVEYHDALLDAKWNFKLYKFLQAI
jgi:hypothetical protein